MTILGAAQCSDTKAAAVAYLLAGVSVIPLNGKISPIGWKSYQHIRPEMRQLSGWFNSIPRRNVGIVCGAVSGNLVVIDLDGEWGVKLFEARFPELLNTLTIRTGSGKGHHLYYYANRLPSSLRHVRPGHEAIEIRANGCYVVAPPSIHPDTRQPYTIARRIEPMPLAHLDMVTDWLMGLMFAATPTAQSNLRPPVERPVMNTGRTMRIANPRAYASAAINREANSVKATSPGQRQIRLNTAAYNLGQLVGDGFATYSECEIALLAAALDCGLTEIESIKTIRGGLDTGRSTPRSEQWQKRKG